MKFCTKCDVRKEYTNFPKVARMRDGRGSWCKACINLHKREVYAVNRINILQLAKERRLLNPEKIRSREKQWRDSNPERLKGALLQRYWPGKTWKQALVVFNLMVKEQNNLCAICGRPETRPSKKGSKKTIRDLSVDHCHTTGTVRGLLCDTCNLLIAYAKDSPTICVSAASYLKRVLHDAVS